MSDGFRALVPLYLDLGKEQVVRIARAPFKGTQSQSLDMTLELPRKPRRVRANARHDILTLD